MVVLLVLSLLRIMLLLILLVLQVLVLGSCRSSSGGLGRGDHQRLGRRGAVSLPRRSMGQRGVHGRELPRVHQAPVRGALAPASSGCGPRGGLRRVPRGDALAQVRRRPGADLGQMGHKLVRARVFDDDGAEQALRGPPAGGGLGLADRAKVLPGPVSRPAPKAAVGELLVAVIELVELLVLMLLMILIACRRRRRRRRSRRHRHLLALCAASCVGRVGDFLQRRRGIRSHRSSRGEIEARAAG